MILRGPLRLARFLLLLLLRALSHLGGRLELSAWTHYGMLSQHRNASQQ